MVNTSSSGQTAPEFDLLQQLKAIQDSNSGAFMAGQEKVAKELEKIAVDWIRGKETNEEFARKLNNFINEYGKK